MVNHRPDLRDLSCNKYRNMRTIFFMAACLFLYTSCRHTVSSEDRKQEVFQTEKAFEKMASEKGIAEAFYYFAAENAVIKRENDSLIRGKENIRKYYESRSNIQATVNWTPDYIEVSDCGTLAYTFGKYVWKIQDTKGDVVEYTGIFHTVWKKQPDGSWRYVWD